MAPNHVQAEVVIQLSLGASITVHNVRMVNVSEIKVVSDNHKRTADCLSLSDIIDLLSITGLSIEHCQLSLQGRVEATITDLTTNNSSVLLLVSTDKLQKIAIRNSEFHYSTLRTTASHENRIFNGDVAINALSIESSLLSNSNVTVNLKIQIVHELSILNTSITTVDSEDGESYRTGIVTDTGETARLHLLVENCHIIGNSQALRITASRSSHVELNVHQCLIANNGHLGYHRSGGIGITQSGNSVTVNKVTSTILSGNKYAQIEICEEDSFSGNTTVTVFNSTINNSVRVPGVEYSGAGAHFHTVNGQLSLNFTQNHFEHNVYGVCLEGVSHKYELNFKENVVLGTIPVTTNGGGLYIDQLLSGTGLIGVVNVSLCHFKNNKVPAMYIESMPIQTLTITETVFEQNYNGIIFDLKPGDYVYLPKLIIKNSIFKGNTMVSLGVESLHSQVEYGSLKMVNMLLKNVSFLNNTNLNAGIVQVDSSFNTSIEDSCVFSCNKGSAIKAFETTVTFSGKVIFENNVAFQGGAISLIFSNITLQYQSKDEVQTSLLFMSNTAIDVGGAIFIGQSWNIDSFTGSSCFYELEGVSYQELKRLNVTTLVFIDNSAINGGMDIYGATPNTWCQLKLQGEKNHSSSSVVEGYIFNLSSESSPSRISSDPKRVCLCDSSSQLMCANFSHIFYNTQRYPGEVFQLNLTVVGFEFGTVTGPVFAYLIAHTNNSNSSLERSQYVRQVPFNACTRLDFTVNSLNRMEIIVLAVNTTKTTTPADFSQISSSIKSFNDSPSHTIPFSLLTTFVYINVTLHNDHCPTGFSLNTDTGKCDCAPMLQHLWINDCTISDSTPQITRSGNNWIKPIFDPEGILISKYCPFNYCKQETVSISLSLSVNDSYKQCALNRIGILCGTCPSSLSLAIGSSRCIECSDSYHILLLIAFAAAGIVLVLFIKVLDVTVSKGTINGLIFYANIIWTNQSVLFPPQNQANSLLQFLKVFIAWLNLDLGIETCFIQHLDGYWKTWLQFAFPAYVWLIAGLIILVSHYSTKATKIFGNNSMPVLATLFLLSYAKLLRTILVVLEFTVLVIYPHGQKTVWSFDGNVQYFDPKHIVLFVAAIIILLVLWLPYTFALLFIQCLRRHSHLYFLRWVGRLKPLFDSYSGPLKDRHHYWTGIGLLARLVLVLTSAATLTIAPFISALTIAITAPLLCLLVLSVYKQWQLSVLEGCFLTNMAMFSSGALFVKAQGWDTNSLDSLACTSLGITFILFLAIIVYHVWRRCPLPKIQRNSTRNGYEDINNIQASLLQSTTHQEVSVPKLREALLEASDETAT